MAQTKNAGSKNWKSVKQITQEFEEKNLFVFYKRIGKKVLIGSWCGDGREWDNWQREVRRYGNTIYGI